MGGRVRIPMLRIVMYLLTALILLTTLLPLTLSAATTASRAPLAKVVISPSTIHKLAKAGKGTPGSPYIVELGTVNAKGYTYGLLIENVSNVVIVNTKVLYAAKDGIHIVNSSNVKLLKVVVSNTQSGSGIYVQGCRNVSIESSVVSGAGWWGIGVVNSSGIRLSRVDVSYNMADGVFMYNVRGVYIDHLRAVANGKKGVYLISCSNIVVKYVYIEGSRDGDSLKLQGCSNVFVHGARLAKAKYWNLCLMGVKNAVIEMVYTTGAGWDGIYIGSSSNVTVRDSKFVRDTYKGVFIELSRDVKIVDSFIEPGMDVGINMKGYCSDISIINNTVVNAGNSGIRVQEGAKVRNLKIVGNIIENSSVTGVDIASTAMNVEILNNTIVRNHHDGIYVYTGSRNVVIEYNNVSYNAKDGIKIKKGVFNVLIARNVIERNGAWAIYIEPGASNIKVEYNEILFNGKHPQAYDDSGATWRGNAWSDYSGKGLYTIAGQAHAVDLEPRVARAVAKATSTSTPSTTTSSATSTTSTASVATSTSSATTETTTTMSVASTSTTSATKSVVTVTKSITTVTTVTKVVTAPGKPSALPLAVIAVCIAVGIAIIVLSARR